MAQFSHFYIRWHYNWRNTCLREDESERQERGDKSSINNYKFEAHSLCYRESRARVTEYEIFNYSLASTARIVPLNYVELGNKAMCVIDQKILFHLHSFCKRLYWTRQAFFAFFVGVVFALAEVEFCSAAGIDASFASVSYWKQSLKWEKVWSSFDFGVRLQSGMTWSRGAEIDRNDGARGVLIVQSISESWHDAPSSGEALKPCDIEHGEGVWHVSSSLFIESTGEFWELAIWVSFP